MNRAYQDMMRTSGYLKTLLDYLRLESTSDEMLELQKWIIYCINCILVDNVENQRFVLAIQFTQSVFSKYQTEVWYKWNRNVALDLNSMLGYGYRT